jgi:hypothetical protein
MISALKYIAPIILITMLMQINLMAQSRWVNNYLEGEDPFVESLLKHYDGGYLLSGRFGPNYPSYNWLIKTDVNGEMLWKKVFGTENSTLVLLSDVGLNSTGDIFLIGLTGYYNEESYDPLIMKLNACGEKEWCRVFVEDGINFSNALVVTPDAGVVMVLRYMNSSYLTDRICLAKFNVSGDMLWKECYNSSDTSLHNEDAFNLTQALDGGFIITGYCGYEDPNPPHSWWDKPYYIKTDSLGHFEWETVVHKEVSDKGGMAWSTVISPDSNFFYSSLSHYYHPPFGDAPALLKMDMSGNVVGIYDLAQPDEYGKMIEAKFITDSTLMASALWGNVLVGGPKAVIIDTLGNIIRQAGLLQNEWLAATEVTFDGKLLYFTNINDNNGNFDAYLFKLNQQLESDTLYTQLFNYDSLCPYPIAWDTIVQDNCGLIVGMEEVYASDNNKENELHIYPNPASTSFKLQSNIAVLKGATVEIYNLYGQVIKTVIVPEGQTEIEIDVKGWDKGLYLVRMLIQGRFVANGMVTIQ